MRLFVVLSTPFGTIFHAARPPALLVVAAAIGARHCRACGRLCGEVAAAMPLVAAPGRRAASVRLPARPPFCKENFLHAARAGRRRKWLQPRPLRRRAASPPETGRPGLQGGLFRAPERAVLRGDAGPAARLVKIKYFAPWLHVNGVQPRGGLASCAGMFAGRARRVSGRLSSPPSGVRRARWCAPSRCQAPPLAHGV